MRRLIWIPIAAIGALLMLNVAYCWNGSLEDFPTEEQQDKIRTVTLVNGVVLTVVEIGLIALARWLRRWPRSR